MMFFLYDWIDDIENICFFRQIIQENEEKKRLYEEQKKQNCSFEKQLHEQMTREKKLRRDLEETQNELMTARVSATTIACVIMM